MKVVILQKNPLKSAPNLLLLPLNYTEKERNIMSDQKIDRKCENCEFFAITKGSTDGQCRKYAPRPSVPFPVPKEGFHSFKKNIFWPAVGKGSWCGEFQPKG